MKPQNNLQKLGWGLLFLAPVVVVVNLQHDATNESGWPQTILEDYYNGTIGDVWTDGVSPLIIRARILMRLLLLGLVKIGHISLEKSNLLLQSGFLAGGCFLVFKTLRNFLKVTHPYSLMAGFLALSFLSWGFLGVGYSISYPYDLPSFFFSALCLYALHQQNRLLFGLSLFLGTLNKETLVFFVPAYALVSSGFSFKQNAKQKFFGEILTMGLVYGLAYFLPRYLLAADSLAITASTASGDQLRLLSNVQHLSGGNGWSLFQNFFWILVLHIPALLNFRQLTPTLKAVYFCVPVFLIPQMIFGNINELRLFNELIPLGAISSVHILSGRLNIS